MPKNRSLSSCWIFSLFVPSLQHILICSIWLISCSKWSWHVQFDLFPTYVEMVIAKIFPNILHPPQNFPSGSQLPGASIVAAQSGPSLDKCPPFSRGPASQPACPTGPSHHPELPSLLLSMCAKDAYFPEPRIDPLYMKPLILL